MNGRPWERSLAPLALCLGSFDDDGTEFSFRLCVDALRDAQRFSLPSLLYKALPDTRASSVRSVHQENFADVHADFLCALCGIAFPGVQGFAAVSVLMPFGPYCLPGGARGFPIRARRQGRFASNPEGAHGAKRNMSQRAGKPGPRAYIIAYIP